MILRRVIAILTATLSAMFLAMPAAMAFQDYAGTFADDDGSAHEADIEAIFDADITDGCNPPDNDEYCPDDFVTRGEMAKFLDRAKGFEDTNEDAFVDDDDSIFEAHINNLAGADVTDGCNPPENDMYCPEEFITRGEMAKFLVGTFGYERQSDSDHFTDDDDSIFEDDINAIKEAEVTFGCNPPENDEYCPELNVTRAEMASFLARALEISHDDPTPFGNETCEPAYFPCVPTVDEMGDLDCDDITEHYPEGVQIDEANFGDPHDLNADGDDMACEPAA